MEDEMSQQEAADNESATPEEAPDMAAVRAYYEGLQADYTRRVSEIEAFLGFAEGAEALGTRLAKIELFLGIKA